MLSLYMDFISLIRSIDLRDKRIELKLQEDEDIGNMRIDEEENEKVKETLNIVKIVENVDIKEIEEVALLEKVKVKG